MRFSWAQWLSLAVAGIDGQAKKKQPQAALVECTGIIRGGKGDRHSLTRRGTAAR
jgi:hypothetical protein